MLILFTKIMGQSTLPCNFVYQTDSFRVLQILKEWVAGGTADTFVEDASNVQEAWNSLVVNYDGADAIAARVQKARNDISSAHFSQDSVNFSFQDYCTRILRANNELDRYNANVDGRSQVTDFLKGIKIAQTTSPIFASIKTNIASDPNLSADLRKAIERFKETMTKLGLNPGGSKVARKAGGTYRHNPGRGGRGRGRGHRGGGRYYGGGGRGNGGRGRGHGGQDYFIKEETLNHLTPIQRKMIFMGRSLLEEQGQHDSQDSGNTTTRQQGSAKRNHEEVDNEQDGDHGNQEDADPGNASSRFGAQGDRNKKGRAGKAVHSTIRRHVRGFTSNTSVQNPTDYQLRARAEMDSRADTVCAGATFALHYATGKVADVSGFHPTMDSLSNIPIGTAITAVDLEDETIILVFNEALYFGAAMEESLIPPAQLWNHGIICDITPKVHSGGKSIHGIYDATEDVYIPFHLHGCISYFQTRLPTDHEKDSCRWITLTSDREWSPYSDDFNAAEQAAEVHFQDPYAALNRPTVDNKGNLVMPSSSARHISALSTSPVTPADSLDPFLDNLECLDVRIIKATSSKERRSSVANDTLARRWGTSVATVAQTMKTTTQRGVRYMDGNLTQRFRTRQRQLQSRYLRTKVYTDTMFSSTPSVRGNTCAQLFVTAEGFAAGDTLPSKSLAHDSLEKFCRRYRIPSLLISDDGPSSRVLLPHGDRNEIAKIIGRKRDADGLFIGRAHQNPALDSRVFTARFPDGEEKDLAFNIIAEHLYSQVDSEGRQHQIFREIIAHRRNKRAVDKADQFRFLPNRKRTQKKTTTGWDLEVEWKDGSTSWLPLKELKETNPVDVAMYYAVANRIDDEPAFSWWVKHVLKKRQRLIKALKSRNQHARKHYKFGIRIPRTVAEALALDQENGNTFWLDAIKKEMGNILDDDDRQLYQSYIGVIRWAVELGRIDLAHAAGMMARFAASPREGHMTQVVRILAYSKKHMDSRIVFAPDRVPMDDITWDEADWSEFYPDV
eukprot:Nitzschia sp. Nitz4//scaffold498_size9664//494//4337//NITZ4_009088-RA/size9664-snap-gene-0.10-mRNA-1//-1//CDS//3329553087//1469//frame0